MVIYQIVHIASGRSYYGQTARAPFIRWREHLYALRASKHTNRHLQSAWNLYGEAAFTFEIIKECSSLSELDEEEIKLIASGGDIFNLAPGGNSYTHDRSTRRRIGEINKKAIVGMNMQTMEIREYLSATDSAVDGFDPGCVRKCALDQSLSHKGWVWASKADTDKLTQKVDKAKRGKVRKERAVSGINVFTGETRQFRSASEAARHGFRCNTIFRCCAGKVKIHKGFIWVYSDSGHTQSLLEEKRMNYLNNPPKTGPKSWQ